MKKRINIKRILTLLVVCLSEIFLMMLSLHLIDAIEYIDDVPFLGWCWIYFPIVAIINHSIAYIIWKSVYSPYFVYFACYGLYVTYLLFRTWLYPNDIGYGWLYYTAPAAGIILTIPLYSLIMLIIWIIRRSNKKIHNDMKVDI